MRCKKHNITIPKNTTCENHWLKSNIPTNDDNINTCKYCRWGEEDE